ncbi:MAG TPA: acyl-CoA dehydrogenase family protein [Blastocatellia bacterium]|nr:acyl-CoA dehydrogenase family protein [Blastocatellia bacterium]
MASETQTTAVIKGGGFLTEDLAFNQVFTPEDISEEQRMFAQTAEEFLRKEVVPREDAIYAKDYAVHRELMRKAGELGLLGIDIPEEYGGLGLNKVSSSIVGEQFALQASFAGTQSSHVNIGTLPIVFFGTEQQKQHYLPKLATGEWIGAYALTEPQSGSDALAAKTKAVLTPDGKHYVLNGQKMWITNGGFADLFTVFAKVDGEKFTAFLVERVPGLTSGHEEKKLGIDGSSTTALMLEDCLVPAENVLGEIGRGHKIAFNVLNIGRLKLGARSVGTMKLAFGQSLKYAKERHQFGQPISNFGMIKHKLAQMAIRAYVGESILYRTAGLVDEALHGVDHGNSGQVLRVLEQYAIECSIIKIWETEALAYVVDEEVQVFGGYGYSKDYPAERNYRDARIARIYEGTNEINRIVIATQLLRRARAGELPLFEAAGRALASSGGSAGSVPTVRAAADGPDSAGFAEEAMLLRAAKNMVLASIAASDRVYGENARDQQEILGSIAEMAAGVYALESALLRTERLVAERGPARAKIQTDIVRVFARDVACCVERAALAVETEMSEEGPGTDSEISRMARRAPFKSVAACRRIADSFIEAGKYNL